MCKYSIAKLPDLNFIINCIEVTDVEGVIVKLLPNSTIFAIIKADLQKWDRVQTRKRRIKHGYETSCNQVLRPGD
jgi:hypothetical protein